MKFVTGSNYPGYLPDADNRGPWNSWRDALADIALMIEDDYDEHEAGNEAAWQSAEAEITTLQAESPHDCDVVFIGRAYFVRCIDEEDEA